MKVSAYLNFTLSLLLFGLVSSSVSAQTGPWELATSGEGIQVFTRTVAKSTLKEFKAEMTVSSSIQGALALLEDIDHYPDWFADCGAARKAKQITKNRSINYLVYEQPFPVSDRDMYLDVEVKGNQQSGPVSLEIQAVPEFAAKKSGYVRIPKLIGFWRLVPKGNGMIHVTYQVFADPGGTIPSFLANAIVTRSPFKTLQNMKKELPAYQAKIPNSLQ